MLNANLNRTTRNKPVSSQTPLEVLKAQLTEKEQSIQLKEQQINQLKEQLELSSQQKLLLEKLNLEKLNLEKELKELRDQHQQLLSNDLNLSLQAKEEELNKLKNSLKLNDSQTFILEDLLEAVNYLASSDLSSDRYLQQTIKEKNTKHLSK